MADSRQKPVNTGNYDLSGNTVERQFAHWIRGKVRIMGNYHGGAGLKCLLSLWVLHRLGKPLYFLRTWLKNQHGLKSRIRGLLSRLKNLRG